MDFKIEWFDQVTSTNAIMREKIVQGLELSSGYIIAAHEQTAGRGRQNRKWLTPPKTNLCFSLFLKTDAPLIDVPSLTMAVALAINEFLHQKQIPAQPKWPNDVLVNGKKICGILSERVDGGIIIGVGLNINMSLSQAEQIDRPATSIQIETGKPADIFQTLETLFQPLEYWIGEWENGGFSNLQERWTQAAGPIGKPLEVHDGDLKKKGILAGFGKHGELLFQTLDGVETIWSGEILG